MKKLILWMSFVAFSLPSIGQVTINPQLPPIGLSLKSQLWNLSLANTSGVGMNIQLQLVVTDVSTNQTVFSAETRSFYLPPNVKQVSASDVMPIVYSGLNPAYPVDANPNGFLPIGVFNFCYSIVSPGAHGRVPMDEACDQAQIEPISPPMLVSPVDSEQVENSRPLFIWIPPVPGSLFSNLSYAYHLVEVQPTQSAADAVQQNVPVLYQPNVRTTNFQYPLSAPALDSNKLYAWQIVASNNSAPVGTSEAWAFRLKKDTTKEVVKDPPSAFYTRLSRENGNAFTICNGQLHFAYLQELNSNSVQIHISDVTNSRQQTIELDSGTLAVRYGDNLLNIDLTNVAGIVNKHNYLMDLTNAGGEHWYLKFEYIKKD
jgi:hypothetical protein